MVGDEKVYQLRSGCNLEYYWLLLLLLFYVGRFIMLGHAPLFATSRPILKWRMFKFFIPNLDGRGYGIHV